MEPNDLRARLCAAAVPVALALLTVAAAARPADRSQIEADWLGREGLRQNAATVARENLKATPEEDAAGGCDGIKDGGYGFHTEAEDDPWWQVDLGRSMPIDRLVIYNRCELTERIAHLQVLLSGDGREFKLLYRHDGSPFAGFTDKSPLVVKAGGAAVRYVRLGLSAKKTYFHLDEVEVYPAGEARNAARGRPASQSSTSQWSVVHPGPPAAPDRRAVAMAIERGARLAASLRDLGVDVGREVEALRGIEKRLGALPAEADAEAIRALYLETRWAVREMAFRNPLLDFDAVLFVKAAPGQFPHMSDQFYGWWSRPGGGVYVLEGFKGPSPRLRCLSEGLPEGSCLRPDLSFDGKKVLFAWCRYHPEVANLPDKERKANLPEDAFYHIFEVNLDGTGLHQLTRGRYDDFDARYLPGGEVVFLSTRKGKFLQMTRENAEATTAVDLPDSYVRCGGDEFRPVPVFTLQAMGPGGGGIRPFSAFENFEWTPAVANDGQVLYTRWDYIDRFNGHFFSLWSAHQDGANPQLVYGNYTVRPQVVLEARPIPGSSKLVLTAGAHHSIVGGSLVLLDRSRGTEGSAPIVRLTPEVPFPETEGMVSSYYASPFPLSEDHFLVGWADRALPPHCRVESADLNPVNAMGIYLYDAFGNRDLIYRDPAISSTSPIPVRPRPVPPVAAAHVAWDGAQEGRLLLQDVYLGLPGVERGTVKSLRVIGVPPKTQPRMNAPSLGVSAEDPGKFLLGTVPVEEDGSAHFRVPSGIPLFFQALDGDGLAVQTMRSLTYIWPGQTLSCIGCHEPRETAPAAGGRLARAAAREPSKLLPGPEGSWPLRFDRLVQPVLDRSCVSCHRPGSGGGKAARLDLSPESSYGSLLAFAGKDLERLAFEKDRSVPLECVARKSKLLVLLRDPAGHGGVRLDAEAIGRLAVWMDLYAQRQGHFSADQETELLALRERLAPMLAR